MKLYKFYIEKKYNMNPNISTISNSDYSLYAITNSKKLAKDFMATRNMDRFILKKDTVEKDVGIEILESYRTFNLISGALSTAYINDDGIYSIANENITATEYEIMVATGEFNDMIEILSESWWVNTAPIECFKGKLKKILEFFEYDKFYKIMCPNNDPPIMGSYDEDDYSAPDAQIDELAVFINIFKDTLI